MSLSRWLPWLAAAVTCAAAIALGNWQTRRAVEKELEQSHLATALASEPRVLDTAPGIRDVEVNLPQRVALRGQFVERSTVYLDNRIVDGVPGLQVVTPLRIAPGAPLVPIARGWIARDSFSHGTPRTPEGTVLIEGLAVERIPRALELGSPKDAASPIWQNFDLTRFESWAEFPVARLVVLQGNDLSDGLKRIRPRSESGAERNRGYALQWYSLAALVTVLSIVYGLRARRRIAKDADGP